MNRNVQESGAAESGLCSRGMSSFCIYSGWEGRRYELPQGNWMQQGAEDSAGFEVASRVAAGGRWQEARRVMKNGGNGVK